MDPLQQKTSRGWGLAICLLACIVFLSDFANTQSSDSHRHEEALFRQSWDRYHKELQEVSVSGATLFSSVAPLFKAHEFLLPVSALRRSLTMGLGTSKIRNFVQKLRQGKAVKVGVVGGSVTHASSSRGFDWASNLQTWLRAAFNNPEIKVINAAIPATNSAYIVVCFNLDLPFDLDLVISEYLLNDGDHYNVISNSKFVIQAERTVRRALKQPSSPAFIAMQYLAHGHGKEKNDSAWKAFWDTAEDVVSSVYKWYQLPALSFRDAALINSKLRSNTSSKWHIDNIMTGDRVHVNDLGHRVFTDILVWFFIQQTLDLVMHPWEERELRRANFIMPPMYPGNEVPANVTCALGSQLTPLVHSRSGFELVDEGKEGKPKVGYIGNSPGDYISFLVDTWRDGDLGKKMPIAVAHLKSYETMGLANVTCSQGCACVPTTIDALHLERVSQMYLQQVLVSQSQNCLVTVTILPGREKNKFKVSAIMLSDAVDMRSHHILGTGRWAKGYFHGGV